MRATLAVMFSILIGFDIRPLSAYELSTHALVTRDAFRMFASERPSAIHSLGLVRQVSELEEARGLGRIYLDVWGLAVVPRYESSFELGYYRRLLVDPLSIVGWAIRGAIREDDLPWDNPQDDPYGSIIRVTNHFFDPAYNRGLWSYPRATDWAIGASDAFNQPNLPQTSRRNHYTIFDAREAEFRALTLKTIGASRTTLVDVPLLPVARQPEQLRNAYWATLFRSLGDVLHLNQDMAQPQHTRNDPHSGAWLAGLGHASLYEAYVEARATANPFFSIRPLGFRIDYPIVPTGLPEQICRPAKGCVNYPSPNDFNKYSDFWSTTPGSTGGKGLADYSNAGFFSAGSNLGSNPYALPSNDWTQYILERVSQTRWDGSLVNDGPPLAMLKRPVNDSKDASFTELGVPLTSVSAWDQPVHEDPDGLIIIGPVYDLVRENYDAQANLLIPRAIAYSAGLLEYFFRGQLEVRLPDEGVYAVVDNSAPICKDTCGFDRVKLKLKNTTPGEDMGPGIAVAVLKYHRNGCYAADLSGDPGGSKFAGDACRVKEEEIVVSDPVSIASLPTGSQQLLAFTFPANARIPINASDVSLQVVFRGQLGTEQDAVVVTTRNIAETNYVAIQNNTDYRYTATTDTFTALPSTAWDTFTQLSIKFGATAPAVATMPQLPPASFGQIAYLTDIGIQSVVLDASPTKNTMPHPLTWNLASTEFYLPAGGTGYNSTRRVTQVRGMYREFVWGIASGDPMNVDLCGTSATLQICTESTLTPLTPASARAWTIVF